MQGCSLSGGGDLHMKIHHSRNRLFILIMVWMLTGPLSRNRSEGEKDYRVIYAA